MKRSGRREPYTDLGVKRLRCVRCGEKATQQWYVCADGLWRPICDGCDVKLNALALSFMLDPEIERKMIEYAAQHGFEVKEWRLYEGLNAQIGEALRDGYDRD